MRRTVLVLALAAGLLAAGGIAVARSTPTLESSGPVSVRGAEASVPFTVGDRTLRQVRYVDQGTVRYEFSVTNRGRLPLRVTGLAAQPDPRLFDLLDVSEVDLGPGESSPLTLTVAMNGCESLSSRSGSFVSELVLLTSQAAMFEDEVVVELPQELRTGSARETSCPRATATSRPQG